MFVAYRIEPVVEYEGSDESRETERFSTLADAQKFWDAKVVDARFNPDDASDDEDVALDCGLKLYWTLYGVHPEENGVSTDEAIADRETETACYDLLTEMFGPVVFDGKTGLITCNEPEPSDAAQMELLESWFPWIGTDGVVGGADIVDRLNEWYEAVGGEFNPEAEEDDDEA